MPRGGARPGAGRPTTTPAKTGYNLQGGHTDPLEFLLEVMGDGSVSLAQRVRVATALSH